MKIVCLVGASGKLGQYMVQHANDDRIHQAPAIVGRLSPSAPAHTAGQ